MAYQYDEMGNVVGEYETEEERRLREAINQPVKQTTVYNPDGTSEVTIKGTPEALSAANPNTPTVTGPVSPDETYKRMLQAESGNKDYTTSGQPVTSPKGAMFASQVMPATAAQPGYGVRPAQSQTPEEYNRVGREYYQALLKQFGDDEQKAAAAYNAGPGRVQQNIQRNQGMMNVSQLPQETQGYLQKVGFNQPAKPYAPQSMEQPSPYSLATGQTGLGIQAPAPTTIPQLQASPAIDFYQKFQDNPRALISMAYTSENVGVPDWMRERMKNRASELITQQRELEVAKQQIPTMSESDIAKTLREKTSGGSYLKAALFGLLGMEQSAMAEAAKLGVGRETMTQINGQPAIVKMAANGTPIEGYNATTGMKLTPEELVIAAQYGTAQKGAQTHTGKMQDMRTGEVYYERTTPQGIELVDNNGKKYTGPSQNLRPFGIGSDIQTKNQIQINELTNKLAFAGPTERAKIVAENEAKYGPLDPAVKQQALGTISGTVPTQPTQAPAGIIQPPPVPGGQAIQPTAMVQPAPTVPVAPVVPGQVQQPMTIAGRELEQKEKLAATEVTGKEKGKQEARIIAQQGFADSTYPLLSAVREEISKSTGSKMGAGVDELARFIGASTKGQEAIAKLNVLAGPIKMNIPRFEGAQSDADVKEYARQAGDFANPKLPVKERLAALDAMETLLKKYDKAGNNDWTFGRTQTEPGTTSSGNKYKRL